MLLNQFNKKLYLIFLDFYEFLIVFGLMIELIELETRSLIYSTIDSVIKTLDVKL